MWRQGRGGGGWALGGRHNPTKIIASLISVIKIVKYFGIVGGALGGGAKILQNDNGAPSLSVIKIVKYCGVWGGGVIGGRQNPTKTNSTYTPLSLSLR